MANPNYRHVKSKKSETLYVEARKGRKLIDMPHFNEFFEGLMQFQYGETPEESNAGFEQMQRAAEKSSLENKARSKK